MGLKDAVYKEFITFLSVSFIASTNPSTHNTVGLVFSNHSSTTETTESGSMYIDLSGFFFVTVYVQHWLNKSSAQLICEKNEVEVVGLGMNKTRLLKTEAEYL